MFIICVQNVRDPDRSLPKIIQQTSTTTGLGELFDRWFLWVLDTILKMQISILFNWLVSTDILIYIYIHIYIYI